MARIPFRLAISALLAVAALAPSRASAMNILLLEPSSTRADLSETFQITLSMDFDDVKLGGQVRIAFDDTVLDLLSIQFDAGLGDDLDFRCPTDPGATSPVTCPPDDAVLGFGSFAGISGARTIAVLTFVVVGLGESDISAEVYRPFADELGDPLAVEGATVQVRSVPGPSPLLIGLVGLAGLASRRLRR